MLLIESTELNYYKSLYFVRTVVLGLKIDLLYRNVELILVVMLYIISIQLWNNLSNKLKIIKPIKLFIKKLKISYLAIY